MELMQVLSAFIIMIDDFMAGPIPLRDLVNGTRESKYKEFKVF